MDPERWQEVQDLFESALALSDVEQARLLGEVETRDPVLATEVRALLVADRAPQSPLDGNAVRDQNPQLARGELVGEYAIEAPLGSGAFGTVYCAVHPILGKRVAAKVLEARLSKDEDYVQRFIIEARAASEIGHPGIAGVFGFGRTQSGCCYYLMELVDGPSLSTHLKEHGPLPHAEVIALLEQLASALDAAHARGIVHRDLKPGNVMLARGDDGQLHPKLVDFGIAKLLHPDANAKNLTQTGATVGTPAYMSPEQVLGKPLDHSSDLYAFGVIAYELVTGVRPFEGESIVQTMMKHVSEVPRPPSELRRDLSASMERAILHLLSKSPALRPPSATEAVRAMSSTAEVSVAPIAPLRANSAQSKLVPFAALAACAGIAASVVMLSEPERAAEKIAAPLQLEVVRDTKPNTAIIHITGSPKGAIVTDTKGLEVGRIPLALTVSDPEVEHAFDVSAKGYRSAQIRLVPKERSAIDVVLERRLNQDLETPF